MSSVFRPVVILLIQMSLFNLSSSHLHEKYFGGETHEGEYIADLSLQSRSRHVIGSCFKFSERVRAEAKNTTFFQHDHPPAPPMNNGVRVKLNVPPALEICAPNFISNDELNQIRNKFEQKESNFNQNPFRAVVVIHPFLRLSSVFLALNQSATLDFFENLKNEIKKFSGADKIDFKIFVKFLLEANRGSFEKAGKRDTEVKKVLTKLLPYHYQCQVCHKDLFPQFVLKLDDHFEEDFQSFAEDTGLEDIGIDSQMLGSVTSFPGQEQVRNLFSQLNQEELDDLVFKYRVDLDMYQYSPKLFYSYVKTTAKAN